MSTSRAALDGIIVSGSVRAPLIELWPEVDRVALCIHRPSGQDPRFRAIVEQLRVPAGSILASAARYLAAGRVSLADLQLMSRYESRSLVFANAERHVEAGFLKIVGDGAFAPTRAFCDAAALVLEVQAHAANTLWSEEGSNVAELADLASRVVSLVESPVPTPAFDGQVAHGDVTPGGAASTLLARVTELRYLRADLHAHALAEVGLAGPRARALARLWRGHEVSDREVSLLRDKGLATEEPGGWRLTDTARAARDTSEQMTNDLTERAFMAVADADLSELLRRLRGLAGEDPRPPQDR